MADIFISYAREGRAIAAVLAKALERSGWSVWWDRLIPPGKTFDEVIEAELTMARCAIVRWSEAAIASRWVREEAQEAGDRDKFVPAMLDGVAPPMGFRRIHAADLAGWRGNDDHPGWQDLKGAVGDLLGEHSRPGARTGSQSFEPPKPAGRTQSSSSPNLRLITITAWLMRVPVWARHLTALLFGYLTALLFGYVGSGVIGETGRTWCITSDYDCKAWLNMSAVVVFLLIGLLASVAFVGIWFPKSVTTSQKWRLCTRQVVLYSFLVFGLSSVIAIINAKERSISIAFMGLLAVITALAWWRMRRAGAARRATE